MESKSGKSVDVEHAGDSKKGFVGENNGRIERYEGRVRESARCVMNEVFKNVPKGEELHYRIPDALLTHLCEERGIERDEAIRLVLDGEGLIELSFGGGADDVGKEEKSIIG